MKFFKNVFLLKNHLVALLLNIIQSKKATSILSVVALQNKNVPTW